MVLWSLLQAHRLYNFFFPVNSIFFVSPPVQREDSDQQDYYMCQGEEYLGSDFLRAFIIDVSNIHLSE